MRLSKTSVLSQIAFYTRSTPFVNGHVAKMLSFSPNGPLHIGLRKTDTQHESDIRRHAKQRISQYYPPKWAENLQGVPSLKIELSNKNTPVQRWFLPGIPKGFEVYIKRDDLTGCSLSGNKARKLEFLLADALQKDCDSLIGCGAVQSNFCRSLSAAGKELGFSSHLLLRSKSVDMEEFPMQGNSYLDQLLGAHIYLVPNKASYQKDIHPRMVTLAEHLRKHCGRSPYVVPIGGTCPEGLFGHIECFDELIRQGALEEFSDLVLATGSGGSAAGFSIGNHLNGGKLRIHGMAVCDDAAYFHGEINKLLRNVGLQRDSQPVIRSEDLIDIVEGVKGRGYGLSTDDELEFILETAATTGIFLDPVYTGKAAFHMVNKMQILPESFKGKKILFYHSGSVLGLMDGRMTELLQSKESYHQIYDWMARDAFPLATQ